MHLFPACSPASAGAELDTEDVGLQLKVLSLMGNPATVVAAAAAGDADTIRDFLSRNPHDVCVCTCNTNLVPRLLPAGDEAKKCRIGVFFFFLVDALVPKMTRIRALKTKIRLLIVYMYVLFGHTHINTVRLKLGCT